ncbi:ABC transporter permease subunit [Thalassotalea sp. PS06]|uniref:ABC transporter permease subunit n=1 Tax=Thalassotalea sp. PS06 TaxID=2594005 RepID=UPI0011626167|nr:ABC transporter permease subunit [Thalassotalea sp. PS06]QDP01517.1 ABC transporter permease subunit [Thalassotalea sp. PS06]
MKVYDLNRILHVCIHEWRRVFVTGSGRLTLLTFFGAWVLLFHYPIRTAIDLISNTGDAAIMRGILGDLGFQQLLQWPVAELSVFWFAAMVLLPFTCVLLSSDQFASDRQRGTVKFYLMRTRRSEFLIGRFLGYATFFTALVFALVVITLTYSTLREPDSLTAAIDQGVDTFIFLVLWLLPFIALTNFLNVLMPSGKKVILVLILMYMVLPLIDYLFASKLQINLNTSWLLPGLGIFATMGDQGPALEKLGQPLYLVGVYILASLICFRIRSLS